MSNRSIELEATLRLALEALEQLVDRFDFEQFTSVCELDSAKDAIIELKEALSAKHVAQPAVATQHKQEPVGFAVMQKPWVGLTNDERMEIYSESLTIWSCMESVEAELKEKNNVSW